jgi:hypothetical protein
MVCYAPVALPGHLRVNSVISSEANQITVSVGFDKFDEEKEREKLRKLNDAELVREGRYKLRVPLKAYDVNYVAFRRERYCSSRQIHANLRLAAATVRGC